MTRADRYLLAESLPPLLFGLLLYSTLVVVSATIPRLEWLAGVPVTQLAYWLLLQLPAAAVQTLPIAMVLAVLLAFGRLTTGNELLALQAGAIPLARVSRVFVSLAVAAALLALALNQWVLPLSNARVADLYWRLTTGESGLFRLVRQDIPIAGFDLTFERLGPGGEELLGVRIERWEGKNLALVLAERARFEERGLRLFDYRTFSLDLSALEGTVEDTEETLRRLVRTQTRARSPESSLLLTMATSEEELVARFSSGGFDDTRSITSAFRAARDPTLPPRERRTARILFHRKLAEPLASLVLLLVAVPLSLAYARSRSVAFGLSLVVTLGWYLLLTFGQLLAQTGTLPPWLGVWLANLVLGAFGVALLSRRVAPR